VKSRRGIAKLGELGVNGPSKALQKFSKKARHFSGGMNLRAPQGAVCATIQPLEKFFDISFCRFLPIGSRVKFEPPKNTVLTAIISFALPCDNQAGIKRVSILKVAVGRTGL
jgi:hypothetical protein